MRTFIAPWGHSGSLDPIMLSSASNTPMHSLTVVPSPSWVAGFSSTGIDIKLRTTLSTYILIIAVNASHPCVVSLVARNGGPWNPFLLVTNSCIENNSASNTCSFGSAPCPSLFFNILPCYGLPYAYRRYSNTSNSGSWSTLANYWVSLSSIIAIPVPLPAKNLFRTSWNWTTDLIQVSKTVSVTFQTNSSRQIPWVYAFPFGISTNAVHPSSAGMDPVSHMNFIISTNSIHWVGLGGGSGIICRIFRPETLM